MNYGRGVVGGEGGNRGYILSINPSISCQVLESSGKYNLKSRIESSPTHPTSLLKDHDKNAYL